MKSFLLYISLVLAVVGAYHALLVPHGETDYPGDDISSTDTATALAQLARKIKENELAKIANTESITAVSTKHSSLQNDISALVSRLSSVETFVNGFSPTVSTDTSNTTTSLPSTVTNVLDDRISSIESEIDDLDTQDLEWKRKIALLEFQLPIQKLNIDGMVTRTDAMLGTIDDLASTVNNVSILAATYEERATNLITTVTSSSNALADSLTERFAELNGNLIEAYVGLSTQLLASSGAVGEAFLIREDYSQSRKPLRVDTGVKLFGTDSNNATACFSSQGNDTKEKCALRQDKNGHTALSSLFWTYVNARGGNHIKCIDLKTIVNGELACHNLGDAKSTNFRADSNYLSTGSGKRNYFRFGQNNPSVSIREKEIEIDGTDVLAKLNALEARLSDIEGNYLDTRKTHTLRSHNANLYLASSGKVDVGSSSSHAKWDIRNR